MSDAKDNSQGIHPNYAASHRRKLASEAMRAKIAGETQITALLGIQAAAETADKESIPALRLKADIALALLKKVLPDLKQHEITGEDGAPLSVAVISYKGASRAKTA